jgi:hypothetical protein
VFDALRAGFARVVFVIRRDFEAVFREQIGSKYSGTVSVDYVFQSPDALPKGCVAPVGREKPWGTGHAVWCARDVVREPFAVINADDFYGADSFAQLGKFLTSPAASPRGFDPMSGHRAPRSMAAQFAMVGFTLANTLSEHGAVARGYCVTGAGRLLTSITERTGILAADVGPGKMFSGNETVSMNCWGFTPALFPALEEQFHHFLLERSADLKAEFYLPGAVSEMIARGQARVTVLPTTSTWFGVTYREDKPRVVAAIAELVRLGNYPPRLF